VLAFRQMALPAFSHTGAVPILDVETMLARLPARVRAELEWVKKPIADGLDRLRTEPLDEHLLDEVSAALADPLLRLGGAFWKSLLASPEEWRALLMQELQAQRRRLVEFLHDPEAEDTLDWVLGYLRSLFSTAFSVMGAAGAELLPVSAARGTQWPDGLRPFLRSQTALMAVTALANSNGSRERAHERLDHAFLDLGVFQAALRREGVFMTAFPDETTEERRRRLSKSATLVRDGLTDEDWGRFDEARVRDLR